MQPSLRRMAMMVMMMGGLFLAMGASAAPLAPLAPLAAVAPLADGRCGFKLGESKERCECVSKADAADSDLGDALSWLCGQPALDGALFQPIRVHSGAVPSRLCGVWPLRSVPQSLQKRSVRESVGDSQVDSVDGICSARDGRTGRGHLSDLS